MYIEFIEQLISIAGTQIMHYETIHRYEASWSYAVVAGSTELNDLLESGLLCVAIGQLLFAIEMRRTMKRKELQMIWFEKHLSLFLLFEISPAVHVL